MKSGTIYTQAGNRGQTVEQSKQLQEERARLQHQRQQEQSASWGREWDVLQAAHLRVSVFSSPGRGVAISGVFSTYT